MYTLLHGDCIDFLPTIKDDSIDLVVIDPPYSLGYNFKNDDLSHEDQERFMRLYLGHIYRIMKQKATCCIFQSQKLSHHLYFAAVEQDFIWQNEIIWNRDGGQMPTKKLGICHEVISVFTKGAEHKTFNLDDIRVQSKYAEYDKRLNPKGKNPGDVWYVPALFGKKLERLVNLDTGKALHPTQKPVGIIAPLILAYSNEKDTVLDCFMGVGTTGIACKQLNRSFIGIEIDKQWYEAAKERMNT